VARASAVAGGAPTTTRRSDPGDSKAAIEIHPVTPDRWPDLVDLFERPGIRGGRTVTNGCWCMFWRVPGKEFDYGWGGGRGSANRNGMKALVAEGRTPGLIAYVDGAPAAWVSIAPRDEFARLERSRQLPRVDGKPVWSVVCFYVHGAYKRQGLQRRLLDAAVDYARSQGARLVEAYGVKPGDSDPFTGYGSMFEEAGFGVVREGGRRSVMRREIRPRPNR
jgi:GNAT superfamily N-acetyltransferase